MWIASCSFGATQNLPKVFQGSECCRFSRFKSHICLAYLPLLCTVYLNTYIHTYIHTYITLHYITYINYITLHYITLRYITLHTMPYIHTYTHNTSKSRTCMWSCAFRSKRHSLVKGVLPCARHADQSTQNMAHPIAPSVQRGRPGPPWTVALGLASWPPT